MRSLDSIRDTFANLGTISVISTESGQKDVFLARSTSSQVVLKILKMQSFDERRTMREIQTVRDLNCTFVPKILRFGSREIDGSKIFYIIEQYIPGDTLRSILKNRGKFPLDGALQILGALLTACAEFQAAKLVHRDLKPENLILAPDNKLWVLDFGIVRRLDLPSLTPSNLKFGLGTLGYSAPEQLRNLKRDLDSRADLFSVGVITYELLNGVNPYLLPPNDPLSVLRKVETTDLPCMNIPGPQGSDLSDLLRSLCSRYPTRRPKGASNALKWFNQLTENKR